MFFHINGKSQLLPEVRPNLCLDAGWTQTTLDGAEVYYKGYVNSGRLEDKLAAICAGTKFAGIYTVIRVVDEQITCYHPIVRPYPLYTRYRELCNLEIADCLEKPNYVPYEPIVTSAANLTTEAAAERILDILRENLQNIVETNPNPDLYLVFSGGVDSLCLWAILDTITPDYKILASEPDLLALEPIAQQDYDLAVQRFYNVKREYESELVDHVSRRYWGYHLTSIDRMPKSIITGFWGDEYMMRNPEQINLVASIEGKTALDLVKPEDYMYYYLNKQTYDNSGKFYVSTESVFRIIHEKLSNDFQMWHLDNHLHFSPYFDSRIYNCVRSMNTADMLNQGLTAAVQRRIIELVNPDFLKFLAAQKNNEFVFENFHANKHTVPHILPKLVTN